MKSLISPIVLASVALAGSLQVAWAHDDDQPAQQPVYQTQAYDPRYVDPRTVDPRFPDPRNSDGRVYEGRSNNRRFFEQDNGRGFDLEGDVSHLNGMFTHVQRLLQRYGADGHTRDEYLHLRAEFRQSDRQFRRGEQYYNRRQLHAQIQHMHDELHHIEQELRVPQNQWFQWR